MLDLRVLTSKDYAVVVCPAVSAGNASLTLRLSVAPRSDRGGSSRQAPLLSQCSGRVKR